MSPTPAGWYPDPYAQGQPVQRYWDGQSWTAHAQWLPAVPPPVHTTPDGTALAGFEKRAFAKMIDYAMISVVATVLELPFFLIWFRDFFDWITSMSDQAVAQDSHAMFSGMLRLVVLLGLITLIGGVVTISYEAVMMKWKAATIGMRLMGIQVRLRESPGPLGWATITRRVGAMYWPLVIAWIPFVGSLGGIYMWVNYLWPLGNERWQALHDIAAQTNVVLVDPSTR